ncbi:hypothetical protein JMJ56_18905 [Belnapia sp. T18]|uniref:Uncharacterized protein n=1 Tax=Belnapia arida TaxID=2804533 RepID=A0ABS1U813_9PROT|nr:hypothetical protein [Belnapia arida]MBL6080094.1 hypothetical protein [Belnapia arida]
MGRKIPSFAIFDLSVATLSVQVTKRRPPRAGQARFADAAHGRAAPGDAGVQE